jgi:hypothetical protein
VLAVQRDDALFIKHDFLIGFLLERIVGGRHLGARECECVYWVVYVYIFNILFSVLLMIYYLCFL